MKARPAAAKPYARALHDLARERNQTDAIGRELDSIAELVRQDAALRDFFARPWVAATAKRNVAVEIATRLQVSKLTHDFVALVAQQGRAEYLEAIAEEFQSLVDESLGRVHASVRTAVPLSDAERATLSARLGRALGGKQVLIDERVDSQLLGGFVAEIGSFIVDGSLDGQLARLGARLGRA